jgi:transposase-like protein
VHVPRFVEQTWWEVPSHHWHLVRTTNLLKRAFQEFQRKFKQIPMMPTPESAERLVFAQCQMRNRKWRGRQIDGWERGY